MTFTMPTVRTFRIAWILILTVLKRRLAYRGDLLLQGLDEIMRGLLAFALLEVYVAKGGGLAGYSHAQLLFVLGFSLIPIALFHCFCSNLYSLSSNYIIQGNLDRVLLRPYPAFLQICFDRLAIEDLTGAVLGSLIMFSAASQIPGFAWDPLHLILLLIMILSAFAVVVAVFMAFAATGFWFEDRVGMVPPVYNLMELGRWPNGQESIYPWWLKWLITCVIPFSFVAFHPASLFLGQGSWWPALATPLVAVISLVIANVLWTKGIRRYSSTGS